MKRTRIFAFVLAVLQVIYFTPVTTFAMEIDNETEVTSETEVNTDVETETGSEDETETGSEDEEEVEIKKTSQDAVTEAVKYLKAMQTNHMWTNGELVGNTDIVDILEYTNNTEYANSDITDMIDAANNYVESLDIENVDDYSRYLLLNDLIDFEYLNELKAAQNSDGGFGLEEDYASDVIDTMLAIRALNQWNQKAAVRKAAAYLTTVQNADGGFGYIKGLKSNPKLTAEIANILVDCAMNDDETDVILGATLTSVEVYLDQNAVALDELESKGTLAAYQNLYTALFKLKKNKTYDISSYINMMGEEKGFLNDSLATALALELIVVENDMIVGKFDHILVTNNDGYAVAAFGQNEDVNFEIVSQYDTTRVSLKVTIETPDKKVLPVDADTLKWNTADYEQGNYTVKAQIVKKSNGQVLDSMIQYFRVEHKLAVDNIALKLSQSFASVGDKVNVDIISKINLVNFQENQGVTVRWNIKDADKVVASGNKVITEADISVDSLKLGQFTPDTKDEKCYIISAEVFAGEELVYAKTSTNFFVSDKGVVLMRDVDKEFLYESKDEATVTAKIREEKVVDLVFTTSSNNTQLISEYAAQIEKTKQVLEPMGYKVNACSVSTSFLTAKDTFAWQEYDHLNYKDKYVSDIPKHIVYTDENIQMLGYGEKAIKDFLLVPDTNKSQKILEFDLQRDNSSDWHTLEGGGFLFNTSITGNSLSGYCIIIGQTGLKLSYLKNVDLQKFRDGSYNYVEHAGKLLHKSSVSNLLAKHHIKIVADNNTVSVWDDSRQVLNNFALPDPDTGNGYGPITSYIYHGCWVRSSFTFSKITMQTITAQSLVEVLDSFNFTSKTSRYVVNLSNDLQGSLKKDETIADVAQKIINKNINFIGIGDQNSAVQYNQLIDNLNGKAKYFSTADANTKENLKNIILDNEEANRIKVEDELVTTDLALRGTLYNGKQYVHNIDKLCVGETINVPIKITPDNLVAGVDCPLLKDIVLTYKDENGIERKVSTTDVILPVISPKNKVVNGVVTDKGEYTSFEDVIITDHIKNTSPDRSTKPLTNIITIYDEAGKEIAVFKKYIPEIINSSFVDHIETWNTDSLPSGIYTVKSDVFQGTELVATSSTTFVINVPENPVYKLSGDIQVAGKIFKARDDISISRLVENVGHYDVKNAKQIVTIVSIKEQRPVYSMELPLDLAIGEKDEDTFVVCPKKDFLSRKSGEYLVKYEAELENGEIAPLASAGFIIKFNVSEIVGDNILLSLDTEGEGRGILTSGWQFHVNGRIHSNTDFQCNCSVTHITGECGTILDTNFVCPGHAIDGGMVKDKMLEIPDPEDVMEELKDRIGDSELTVGKGSIYEANSTLRIYGDESTLSNSYYTDKELVIESLNLHTDNDAGILICCNNNVIIRSTDVDFKGIIFAPNSTVRIESANVNLKGRIVAKNIIYQGTIFKGEAFDGDLELFND